MGRTRQRIIDLAGLSVAKGGDQGGRRAAALMRFAGEVVSIASLLAPAEPHQSSLSCRRRPQRRPCPGRLVLTRIEHDDDIRWECPACGDCGIITHWHESRWDQEPALRSGQVVSLLQVRARHHSRRKALQPTRSFEFRIELIGGPIEIDHAVSRRVRIGGDKTLHELHLLIKRAFDREEDEPYEFMFGAPYELGAKRFAGGLVAPEEPDDQWETQLLSVDDVGIEEGQTFGYLFDFGEEWVHRLEVVSVSKETSYVVHPRVMERVGSSPPQHPDLDELWEDEDLWTEFDEEFPLTGLYGPYDAETTPSPSVWLAMEDFERLLLVLEAHARGTADDHPAVEEPTLHAVIHFLAENALARGDAGAAERLHECLPAGASRHERIHSLGEELVRASLSQPPSSFGQHGGSKIRR